MLLLLKAQAQIEFTRNERLFFLGADMIEGKKIISGIYVTPVDNTHMKLELDVLDDWKHKDSVREEVALDPETAKADLYFIRRNADSVPAYRYTNARGYELLLAKESYFEYTRNGKTERNYAFSYAVLSLPGNRQSYVRTLPLMFEK